MKRINHFFFFLNTQKSRLSQQLTDYLQAEKKNAQDSMPEQPRLTTMSGLLPFRLRQSVAENGKPELPFHFTHCKVVIKRSCQQALRVCCGARYARATSCGICLFSCKTATCPQCANAAAQSPPPVQGHAKEIPVCDSSLFDSSISERASLLLRYYTSYSH